MEATNNIFILIIKSISEIAFICIEQFVEVYKKLSIIFPETISFKPKIFNVKILLFKINNEDN